jgi:hypothetical protein
MDIEVYQTVKEDDGRISAYIHFKDDSGKIIKSACIQGKTQADFKSEINACKARIESEKTRQDMDIALVSAAINEVKKEI